jgi:AraC-like DNA-binding protein
MAVILESRPSDSPYVQEIWRAHSVRPGAFVSMAASHWEIVVSRYEGVTTTLTVRGPETTATPLDYSAGGEWFGVRFTLGTLFSLLPARELVDREITLPAAGSRTFWLHGSAWPFPEYDQADAFVDRLVRNGLLVRDPVVAAAAQGHLPDVSARAVQRRFLQATGLTQRTVRQIDRAREALTLLQQGVPILDVVHEAGYYDQPHLTRALKRWIGQTPAQIAGQRQAGLLSL